MPHWTNPVWKTAETVSSYHMSGCAHVQIPMCACLSELNMASYNTHIWLSGALNLLLNSIHFVIVSSLYIFSSYQFYLVSTVTVCNWESMDLLLPHTNTRKAKWGSDLCESHGTETAVCSGKVLTFAMSICCWASICCCWRTAISWSSDRVSSTWGVPICMRTHTLN